MNEKRTETGSIAPDIDLRVHMALETTQLAHERTHLAWIRTVITMITAGLAIDKGMEVMHRVRMEAGNALFKSGHTAGLVLTISGTVLLLFSSAYYISRTRQLTRMRGKKASLLAPGILLSLLIFLICILFIYLVITTDMS